MYSNDPGALTDCGARALFARFRVIFSVLISGLVFNFPIYFLIFCFPNLFSILFTREKICFITCRG